MNPWNGSSSLGHLVDPRLVGNLFAREPELSCQARVRTMAMVSTGSLYFTCSSKMFQSAMAVTKGEKNGCQLCTVHGVCSLSIIELSQSETIPIVTHLDALLDAVTGCILSSSSFVPSFVLAAPIVWLSNLLGHKQTEAMVDKAGVDGRPQCTIHN